MKGMLPIMLHLAIFQQPKRRRKRNKAVTLGRTDRIFFLAMVIPIPRASHIGMQASTMPRNEEHEVLPHLFQ
jgi:hypothetical protein